MSPRIDPLPTSQAPGPALGPYSARPTDLTPSSPLLANILGDAAEEISLHMGDRVEKKTHAERKVRTQSRPSHLSLDQISEYLKKAGKIDDLQQMASLSRQWSNAKDSATIALARRNTATDEPTDHFLRLQHARATARAEGAAPETLSAIDEAIGDLADEASETIQTDLSTIDAASAHGQDRQEIRQFQGSVHALLGQPTMALALQKVLQLSGGSGAQLDSAVENLLKALGACLGFAGSAPQKALLEALITDLYHLKSLKTVFEGCRTLVRGLQPHLVAPPFRKEQAGVRHVR